MSKRKMWITGIVLVALAVLSLGLIGCGGGDTTTTTAGTTDTTAGTTDTTAGTTDTTAALKPVTLAASATGTGGLFARVVKDLKLDKENGLDVTVKTFTPSDAMMALVNGQVDVSFLAVTVLIDSNTAKKAELRWIQPSQRGHGSLFVGVDSPIKSLQDLKGKRIGSVPRTQTNYMDLAFIVKSAGLDLEKDCKLTFGDAPVLEGLFKQGQLDAFTAYEPASSRLILSGQVRELINYADEISKIVGGPVLPLGYAADLNWIEADPERAKGIAAAIGGAQKALLEDPELWWTYREYFGMDSREGVDMVRERFGSLIVPAFDANSLNALEAYLTTGVNMGLFKTAPPIDQIIYTFK